MESWSAGVSRGLATGGYRESGAKRRVAVISTVGSYCWGHTHAAGRDNEGPQIRTNLTVSQTGAQQALGQTDRQMDPCYRGQSCPSSALLELPPG